MASTSKQQNGNHDIYARLGHLEVDIKALATELEGFAAHTSSAIDQMAKRIDSGKPNWVSIIAVFLAFAGLVGTLFTVSTDGKIEPVKTNVAHLKTVVDMQVANRNRELELRTAHEQSETKLRDDINALMHLQFDRRVTAIEDRLRTRMSDADDAQDARVDALQREIDMIRGKASQ